MPVLPLTLMFPPSVPRTVPAAFDFCESSACWISILVKLIDASIGADASIRVFPVATISPANAFSLSVVTRTILSASDSDSRKF